VRDYALERDVDRLIRIALDEDLPTHDCTTVALGLGDRPAEAVLLAKQDCTLSGLAVAGRVFAIVDPATLFEPLRSDGETVRRDPAGPRLRQRRGGARRRAHRAQPRPAARRHRHSHPAARRAGRRTGCLVLDTRKTTPGWRLIEKAAVRDGGGANHRFSLSDGVLIKDNHVRLAGAWRPPSPRPLAHTSGTRSRLRRKRCSRSARPSTRARTSCSSTTPTRPGRGCRATRRGPAVLESRRHHRRQRPRHGGERRRLPLVGCADTLRPAIDISLEFL